VKVHVEVIVLPTGTVTGEGLQAAVKPVAGLTVVDKATAPANPFVLGGLPRLVKVKTSVALPVAVLKVSVEEAGLIL
jgi:hypothetical protein